VAERYEYGSETSASVKSGDFLTTRGTTGRREGLRSMGVAFSRVGVIWKRRTNPQYED